MVYSGIHVYRFVTDSLYENNHIICPVGLAFRPRNGAKGKLEKIYLPVLN